MPAPSPECRCGSAGPAAATRSANSGSGPALHFLMDLAERLDRLLPQTQCGQCGFSGCRPYAEAMARGEADIDRCPPGGDAGAHALARLLQRPPKPYDRARGEHKPPQVALIVEADCIGCTKCIQACPVDAIVGGSKLMQIGRASSRD